MGRLPMTGSAKPGGRIHDQHRKTTARESLEGTEGIPTRDAYSEVDLRVEVDGVLAGLDDQRDRLIARAVGMDKTWAEVAPLVGLAPVSVKNRWNRITKPELRQKLAHLEGVA